MTKKQKLGDHVRELRKRFVISASTLFVASIAIYFVYEPILDFLRAPLGQSLYYDTPAGSFAFVMKLCAIGGLLVAMPVLVYNVIMFIRPAFMDRLRIRKIVSISIMSGILAIAGAAFGYYVILSQSLHFFAEFQVDGLNALISADNYLNFVTNIILIFVLVFQIPIIISFINRIRPINPKTMLKGEKWVILGSLCVSLMLPFAYDLMTSLLISTPIFVLYNIAFVSVLVSRVRMPSMQLAKLEMLEVRPKHERRFIFFKKYAKKQQVEQAMQPLSWMQDNDNLEQEFSRAFVRSRKGAMDIAPKRVAKDAVEPAEWYVRRQEKLQMAKLATYKRPDNLVSI